MPAMDDVTVKDLFNYGVPTGILLIVLWAIWRILGWVKANVVEPVVKSHLDLINVLKENVPKLVEDQKFAKEAAALVATKMEIVATTAAATAAKNEKQLDEIQATLDTQTGVLKTAIDYQTTVIEERNARRPDPGSLHRVPGTT